MIDEHVGRQVPTKTNATITDLWLCYSVKNTIHKHVAILKHSTHHLNDLMTVVDALTGFKS